MNPNPLARLENILDKLWEYSIFSTSAGIRKPHRPIPPFMPRPFLAPPPIFMRRPPARPQGAPVPNPLQTLAKGLSTTLSQIAKTAPITSGRPAGEDYHSIVREFIPVDAEILTPEYPSNSKPILLADLDGDSKDELIVSYRLNDEILTTVLKKTDAAWHKVGEMSIPGYNEINYRGVESLSGEGMKQLLLGCTAKGKTPVIYGYEMFEDSIIQIFARNYRWLELVKPSKDERNDAGAQLAIWNETGNDTYEIELLRWNGLELEPQDDVSSYYGRSVVPYYIRKVQRNPNSPSNWYNLAQALVNAEAYRDAAMAIDVGMRMDVNKEYGEKFDTLRTSINPVQ